ncbi:hypothetical protein LCGC14_3133190 [marine sediment metagenome]|uniref:Uncharacterized protein n=1 Tax=marine sediment metagenome TaxID=412755 RepID=A0A0F8VZ29_9ZZZZ
MELLYLILAMLVGSGAHILKKVVQRRKTDETFSLKDFLTKYPYKTALAVLAGVGGFLGLQAAGELTMASAFMTGYIANSLGGAAENNVG